MVNFDNNHTFIASYICKIKMNFGNFQSFIPLSQSSPSLNETPFLHRPPFTFMPCFCVLSTEFRVCHVSMHGRQYAGAKTTISGCTIKEMTPSSPVAADFQSSLK